MQHKPKIAGEVQTLDSKETNTTFTLEELEPILDNMFLRPIDITIRTESVEPVIMDEERQKLEIDITQEFEVADGEVMIY